MLLKIFNGRNTFLQLIIVVAYILLVVFMPVKLVENDGFNPLYQSVYNLLFGNPILIKISFIILLLAPIIITQLFSVKFGLFKRQHYHFLFLAPLLIFSYQNAWVVSPVLLALPIVILGVQQLFQVSNMDKVNEELAFSAITFSLASLFYTILIWDVILLIIALFLFRQFNIHEVFVVLASFIIPYIYLFSWYFIRGDLSIKINEFVDVFLNINIGFDFNQSLLETMLIVIVFVFSVLITYNVFANIRNKLIQIRTYTSFLFWGLVFSILLILFAGDMLPYHFIFILYCVAILAGIYFAELKNSWLFESFIILFLLHNLYLMYNILYA
jgi:hypothetical protein